MAPGEHEIKDMHKCKESIAMLKAKGRVALKLTPASKACKLEMIGAVCVWLSESCARACVLSSVESVDFHTAHTTQHHACPALRDHLTIFRC